jgi:hypothetical protein
MWLRSIWVGSVSERVSNFFLWYYEWRRMTNESLAGLGGNLTESTDRSKRLIPGNVHLVFSIYCIGTSGSSWWRMMSGHRNLTESISRSRRRKYRLGTSCHKNGDASVTIIARIIISLRVWCCREAVIAVWIDLLIYVSVKGLLTKKFCLCLHMSWKCCIFAL